MFLFIPNVIFMSSLFGKNIGTICVPTKGTFNVIFMSSPVGQEYWNNLCPDQRYVGQDAGCWAQYWAVLKAYTS